MRVLLPPTVEQALAKGLGEIRQVRPLSGGDVSRAAWVETEIAGNIVIKWHQNAPPGLFDAEADGLSRLRRTRIFRVPEVLALDDAAVPAWIALEALPAQPQPTNSIRFGQRFGEALAALHHDHPAPDHCFGLERGNYLGSQPQDNTLTSDWPTFYRDRRLLPQIARAKRLGLLPPEREQLLKQVTNALDTLLSEFIPQPVLIHGDLWSGNFLYLGDDQPVLIDPAVYYAEREVEIAYTELFGGFPPGFHAAYQAAWPLSGGYERRRPLHQLYPLLIHLNHFGETYGPAVDNACRNSLGRLF